MSTTQHIPHYNPRRWSVALIGMITSMVLVSHGAPARTPQWLIEIEPTAQDAQTNVFNWYKNRGMNDPESQVRAMNFGSDVAVLSLPSGGDEIARQSLQKVANVMTVWQDVEYTLSAIQANAIPGLDNLDGTIDGQYQFPDNAQGQGVDCYVIDSGVDVLHADLGNRATIVDLTGEGLNDLNGHGTHVGGTIAGTVSGVAKQANIIGIKVFDRSGRGSSGLILQALQTVAQMVQERGRPSVINMSLGGPRNLGDGATQRVIQALNARGIAIVAAAGNEAQDACNVSPAFVPEIITVGAIDPRNDLIANFSNFGQCADVFAPGVRISSASANSGNGFALLSGTSMASPHVAGVMAAFMSTGLTNQQARERLQEVALKGIVQGNIRGSPNSIAKIQ